ncbi:MAG: ribosomal L7Ae/L30e/S12e/Gadd45 family protein [Nanoarchaeota archaeon]|nr:ribosomal L7Ae/L30e/S12e/Gadd45 family protein [Nanoarchaeota archaeon]
MRKKQNNANANCEVNSRLELNTKNKMASTYDIVEKAAKTGKVDKGVNEVTKAVERGVAKLVVVASDIDPKELTQHLSILCKEKGIKYAEADSREKLGISVGINRPAAAVAVIQEGEANLDSLD